MRTRRKIQTLASCGVVAITALCFFAFRESEPTYNGYKLSKLVVLYDRRSGSGPAKRQMASRAIFNLGTNVIPFLIKWMEEGPTTVSLYRKLTYFETLHTRTSIFATRAARMEAAIVAFQALGTNADFAVPPLTRFMLDTTNPRSSSAAYALGYIQRESAVHALVAVLTNATVSESLKESAASALEHSGASAATAIPTLIGCLENKDPDLARLAAGTLGELQLYPNLVVPALVKMTQRNDLTKTHALYALGEFGTRATNATDTVLLALHDPDDDVRNYATNALKSIAPALLTNSPSQ